MKNVLYNVDLWRKVPRSNTNLLNAYFVTGFFDAESSFIISITKNRKLKIGWEERASFQISLHQKDLALLKLIRNYFNDVGNIYIKDKDIIHYQVNSIQDLIHVIIPHFDKYSLLTQKRADFELFKLIVNLINKKEHLTLEGFNKIIAIKYSLNMGLSENQNKSGIYLWTNLIDGKQYVGSRFLQYFNINHLIQNNFMYIYRPLLKHGYSNFSLSIIEYCSIKEIYKREDYYLNLLDPEYNILQKAGSSLGYKHSEEARKKMSIARTGEKKSNVW